MKFQLSKDQTARRATLVSAMREAHDELTAAVISYNERLSALREFAEETAAEFRDAFDEKSERWQEGDAGQEVDAWIQEFENVDMPDDIDEPDETVIDAIEAIDDRRPARKARAIPVVRPLDLGVLDAIAPISPQPADDQADEISTIVESFPATFGLRAHDGVFRASHAHSYLGDNGKAVIYTERRDEAGAWHAFAKGTAQEIRSQMVRS